MNQEMRRLHLEEYPFLLRQIPKPPRYLDIIGDLSGPEYKYLCVIGSRKYTAYGKKACRQIILGLKGYPIVIVAGLAIGIDSFAHEAAIEAGLKTISFPGSGLLPHVLYPPSKKSLARRIVETGGALISPFARDQVAADWTFPVRNGLMAAISHAVLIIEASHGSGTLLTAQYAVDYSRDIFVVPGDIDAPSSYGPHMLLRRGAAAITCPEDVLDELGFNCDREDRIHDSVSIQLTPVQKDIVDRLQVSPLSVTELIAQVGMSVTELNIAVSQLELSGLVTQANGICRMSH